MSNTLENLIKKNKSWAKEKVKNEKTYFNRLAKGQSPSIFWIGCCDSRVIPTEIFQCSLGEIFVQTNIANQVLVDDCNMMSSLEYAVNVLKVEHIIVCGHTCCGGIQTSMIEPAPKLPKNIQKWIRPLQKYYQEKKDTLPKENNAERVTAISCANVKHQVETLADLDIIQNLQNCGQGLTIHGLLFSLETGLIEKLVTVDTRLAQRT